MKLDMYVPLIARVLLAAIFVLAGINKVFGFAGTAGYIASVGMPLPELMAVGAIIVEIVGGVMLALGYKARHAALALAGFTLVATAIFHNNWADQMQMLMALKNIAIIGGLLMVYSFGSGPKSWKHN
jgi:putative oxidoreductase